MQLFDIKANEWSRVKWMLGHSMCLGIAKIFSMSAANALFLSAFGSEGYPMLYIAISFIIPITGFLFIRAEKVLTFTTYLRSILVLLIVTSFIFRIGFFFTESKWLLMGFAIFQEVIFTLAAMEFWALAGRLFNVREGKRLFGMVSSGEFITWSLGGLLVPVVLPYFGLINLIWLVILGLCGMLFFLEGSRKQFSDQINRVEQNEKVVENQPDQESQHKGYMWMIVTLTVLLIFVFYVADLMFYERVETRFANADEIGSFLGLFFAVVGGITIFGRFVSGPFMSRFGVGAGMLSQPVFLLLLTAGIYVADFYTDFPLLVFWLVMATKLSQRLLNFAFTQPSMNVLFQPMPLKQRSKILTLTSAIVEPIAGGVCGLLLLGLVKGLELSLTQMCIVFGVILLLWIVVGLATRKQYIRMLMNALTYRTLGGSQLKLNDQSSLKVLFHGLESSYVGEVLYSLHMLEQIAPEKLKDKIPPLLDHSENEIRCKAINICEKHMVIDGLDKIKELVDKDVEPKVRMAAIQAQIAMTSEEFFEDLIPFLKSEDEFVRKGAIAGFLKSGGLEGIIAAGEQFMQLRDSNNSGDRFLAAEIIGIVDIPNFYHPLYRLAKDEDADVRRKAISVAGSLGTQRLWPLLIESMKIKDLHSEAMSAVVQVGEPIIPLLSKEFDKHSQTREFKMAAARACGRINCSSAIEFLVQHLTEKDPYIRYNVLKSLAIRQYEASEDENEKIIKLIKQEIKDIVLTYGIIDDLNKLNECKLLKNALLYECQHSVRSIFYLLSFLYPAEAVFRAQANLSSSSTEKNAYALELLDTFLSPELSSIIFPIIENATPRERLDRLKKDFPYSSETTEKNLVDILNGNIPFDIPWLRVCALYSIQLLKQKNLSDEVVKLLDSPEEMIRQTALEVMWYMDDSKISQYAEQLKSDDSSYIRQISSAILNTPDKTVTVINQFSVMQKVIILKQVSIFEGLPERYLVNIADIMVFSELEQDKLIFSKGEIGDRLYIVVDGTVRVHDGEHKLTELGANSVFGEMAILDSEPRSASITTISRTSLFSIDSKSIKEVMSSYAEVSLGILRVLVQRLRGM